ncbi:AAA family ATPase [Candidatus Curtissbacteria bacterium]|nr:AAA family ATPase [Candidatus Curtissbacteria bacterium]
MKKGLVIGKFYPLHAGHQYLIETALSNSDQVAVIVTGKKDQIIPATIRAAWIREIYPQVEVKLVYHNIADDNDEAWAKNTIKWLGFKPDIVFTSENYGDHYSQLMGAKHVPVDIPRIKFPISGTKIREKPHFYSQFLHPIVRAYFVKRVCLIGAESTGTTTLAEALAKLYKTSWVPEFGRFYTEGKVTSKHYKWADREFTYIAQTQNGLEDELAKYASKVLFCDTNSLATYVWQELFLKRGTEEVKKLYTGRSYDLYIVTGIDVPFTRDNIRVKVKRVWMHKRFIDILEKSGQRYIVATGDLKNRIAQSEKEIKKVLQDYKIEEKIL